MNLVGVLRGGIIRRTSPVSGLGAALVPAIVLLLGATFAQAADRDPFRVAPVVALEAESFALQEVRLLPGRSSTPSRRISSICCASNRTGSWPGSARRPA